MEMQESNIVKVFGMKWCLAISFLFLLACNTVTQKVPYFFSPDLSPTWNLQDTTTSIHTIGTFQFLNQNGELFGSKELQRKVYVANFFFTSCPSICPKMTNNLHEVDNHFNGDSRVQLVSFSVTPELDSVSRLNEYHSTYNMSNDWNLLTGSKSEIYKLSRTSFFVEEEIGLSKDSSDFLHTERCMLIDQNSRIRGFYNATVALDMKRLIDDITIILEENE